MFDHRYGTFGMLLLSVDIRRSTSLLCQIALYKKALIA